LIDSDLVIRHRLSFEQHAQGVDLTSDTLQLRSLLQHLSLKLFELIQHEDEMLELSTATWLWN
jgi:hypothetical protein